jgi:hypothetical protein
MEADGRLNILCWLSYGRRRWWFGGLPWLWWVRVEKYDGEKIMAKTN